MIRLLIIFLIAAAALFVGPLLVGFRGDIFIQIGDWKIIQTTVTAVVVMLLGILLIIWFVLAILKRILRGTKLSFSWLGGRKGRKSREQTQLALVKFLEGDYPQAEKLLIKSAPNAQLPELNYLLAAEIAQKQRKFDESQRYLVLAADGGLKSNLAIDITQIRLLIEKNDLSTATVRIDSLLAKYPSKPELLRLAVQIYQRSDAYSAIISLLPMLKKQRIQSEPELQALTHTAYQGLMTRIIQTESKDALTAWWKVQQKSIVRDGVLQAHYLRLLIENGFEEEASQLFNQFFKQQPSAELLSVLELLKSLDWQQLDKKIARIENKFSDKRAVEMAKEVIAANKV